MATARGQSIRFHESDVRPMGRGAAGDGFLRELHDATYGLLTVHPHGVRIDAALVGVDIFLDQKLLQLC